MPTLRITDVAPRDGLQNEARPIPTADKAKLVRLLAATGVDEVEITSFVSPKWVPQLGDAVELCELIRDGKPEGVCYSALVPNEKGLHGLLAVNGAGSGGGGEAPRLIDKASVFTAASETFAQRNTNASIRETLARFTPVIGQAKVGGLATRGYISCVVACPFEGPIAPDAVAEVARSLVEMGIDELDLGDTIGAATPETITRVTSTVMRAIEGSGVGITLHLHDTEGHAAACAVAAYRELGITSFDASAGGLGGCPYASKGPGDRAPGNIATMTLLSALLNAGASSSIDTERLVAASAFAASLTGAEGSVR